MFSGIAGLALVARRSVRERDDRLGIVWAFAIAALVVALVAILQGPYSAGSRAVAALMFAVPAAYFLVWLFRRFDLKSFNAEMALYVIVFAALIVLAVLGLISYTETGQVTHLWLLAATVAMAVVLTVVFLYVLKQPQILSLALVVVVAALTLFNLATASGLAYDARSSRFPALYESDTRSGIYDLVITAGDVSEREQGYRWALPMALVTGSEADDLLQWYLRPAPELQLVEHIGLENAPPHGRRSGRSRSCPSASAMPGKTSPSSMPGTRRRETSARKSPGPSSGSHPGTFLPKITSFGLTPWC